MGAHWLRRNRQSQIACGLAGGADALRRELVEAIRVSGVDRLLLMSAAGSGGASFQPSLEVLNR